MAIGNCREFDIEFSRAFRSIGYDTLVNSPLPRIRLNMAEAGENKCQIVIVKTLAVLDFVFEKTSLWERIAFWDVDLLSDGEMRGVADLRKLGYSDDADVRIDCRQPDALVWLRHWRVCRRSSVKSIVSAIAGFELGEELSANISCYFISFEKEVIVNLYDDRGMDIVSNNIDLLRRISTQFSAWVSH